MSIDPATDALAAACARAGVEIRTVHERSELAQARRIFDEVWPSIDGGTQVQPNLLHALLHAGGYGSVAYADGVPVGAALGFLGRHRERGGWQSHLHSHMAAVLESHRDRHIGTALKLHQRVWARSNGIPVITWTFDPLVRRNARLNLLKLGVEAREYAVDFYGPMDDALNAGDPTDRLFAWWVVDSARADDAALGRLAPLPDDDLDPDWRIVELPEDIIALRSTDPDAALTWRLRVRAEITSAFERGDRIIGVSASGGYVLGRDR